MPAHLIVGTTFDLEIEFWRDGRAIDLTGAANLQVKLIKPSGNVIMKTPTIVDQTAGIVRAHILDTENTETGPIIGQCSGEDGAGFVIAGYTPDLYVYPSR